MAEVLLFAFVRCFHSFRYYVSNAYASVCVCIVYSSTGVVEVLTDDSVTCTRSIDRGICGMRSGQQVKFLLW